MDCGGGVIDRFMLVQMIKEDEKNSLEKLCIYAAKNLIYTHYFTKNVDIEGFLCVYPQQCQRFCVSLSDAKNDSHIVFSLLQVGICIGVYLTL